ncbi:hypothetical protein PMAYCL1PPCAC_25741, partial [Pristionchus mayeri]
SADPHFSMCGEMQFCTGDYCYTTKPTADSSRVDTGCITPREDVWKESTLPLCEINAENATLCLCNSGDLCNSDAFSSVLDTGPFVQPKVIECLAN